MPYLIGTSRGTTKTRIVGKTRISLPKNQASESWQDFRITYDSIGRSRCKTTRPGQGLTIAAKASMLLMAWHDLDRSINKADCKDLARPRPFDQERIPWIPAGSAAWRCYWPA